MNDHWIGLELRHLTTLRAIAEKGSFKGAARELGYTPSAISQQIAALERIVGVQVIERERGRRTIRVTDAGRLLLSHMSVIEARLSAAKADIEAATSTSGTLRVGTCESVGRALLPDILRRFGQVLPGTRVEVGEALADLDLLGLLERGALDVAFSLFPLPNGPFSARPVLEDPWVLVVPKGVEPSDMSAAGVKRELSASPLATLRSPSAVKLALDRLQALDVEVEPVRLSDYNGVVQGFAASGLGNALLPRLAVNPHDNRTTIIDLGALIPPREIVVVRHADRTETSAIERFVSLAVEVGSEHDRAGEATAGRATSERLRTASEPGRSAA